MTAEQRLYIVEVGRYVASNATLAADLNTDKRFPLAELAGSAWVDLKS
jgi:hypothetical protein